MLKIMYNKAKSKALDLVAKDFTIEYKSFKEGDYGDLERIEINSTKFGGSLEFWTQGYACFELIDYETGEEYINKMFFPHELEAISSFIDNYFSMIKL